MKKRKFWIGCVAILSAGVLLAGCGKKAEEESVQSQDGGQAGIVSILGSVSSENQTEGSGEVVENKDDWSKKYEHYFEEHPLDNTVMEVEEETEGQRIFLRFALGTTEDMVYVKYAVWEGSAKKKLDTSEENNYVVVYYLKNGEGYIETVMKGKKTEYQKASGLDWNRAAEMTQTDDPMGLEKAEDAEITYDHEEVIDGVTYDVLYTKTLRQTKSKANRWVKNYFYINRETQQLAVYELQDANEVLKINFTPLDTESFATIPEEMKNGKKIKAEEFDLRFALAIAKITYNSVGIDPDKLNLEATFGLKK